MDKQITDKEVYPALWVTMIAFLLGYFLWKYLLHSPTISQCWILENWNIYCLGCGGTRSLIALLQGDLVGAIYYHLPLVVAVNGLGVYMLSQSIWRIFGKRGWVMRYQRWWASGFWVLLVLNCLLHNILLICFDIAM